MELIYKKTYDQIMQDTLDRLQETPITEIGPGGIARLFIASIAVELEEIYDSIDTVHQNSLPSKATGDSLNSYGFLLNCPRLEGESDDNYRYRLSKHVTTIGSSNETAIRLAVLTLPGVRDVVLRPYTKGAGSFGIYVAPISSELSTDLISSVQDAVMDVKGYGIVSDIVYATNKEIRFQAKLFFKNNPTEQERGIAKTEARNALIAHISSLGLGQPLILNNLLADIINSNDFIEDIEIMNFTVSGVKQTPANVTVNWNEIIIAGQISGDIQII